MKTKIFLTVIFLTGTRFAFAYPPGDGKSIFMMRCAACHNVSKQITGPALAGIEQRHSIDWIVKFVQSSQSMVKSGDTAAVTLFQKFNKVIMPDHGDLTDENIKSILVYIQEESKANPVSNAPFEKPGKRITLYKPISLRDYGFIFGYLATVAALVITLFYVVQFNTLRRRLTEKKLSQ